MVSTDMVLLDLSIWAVFSVGKMPVLADSINLLNASILPSSTFQPIGVTHPVHNLSIELQWTEGGGMALAERLLMDTYQSSIYLSKYSREDSPLPPLVRLHEYGRDVQMVQIHTALKNIYTLSDQYIHSTRIHPGQYKDVQAYVLGEGDMHSLRDNSLGDVLASISTLQSTLITLFSDRMDSTRTTLIVSTLLGVGIGYMLIGSFALGVILYRGTLMDFLKKTFRFKLSAVSAEQRYLQTIESHLCLIAQRDADSQTKVRSLFSIRNFNQIYEDIESNINSPHRKKIGFKNTLGSIESGKYSSGTYGHKHPDGSYKNIHSGITAKIKNDVRLSNKRFGLGLYFTLLVPLATISVLEAVLIVQFPSKLKEVKIVQNLVSIAITTVEYWTVEDSLSTSLFYLSTFGNDYPIIMGLTPEESFEKAVSTLKFKITPALASYLNEDLGTFQSEYRKILSDTNLCQALLTVDIAQPFPSCGQGVAAIFNQNLLYYLRVHSSDLENMGKRIKDNNKARDGMATTSIELDPETSTTLFYFLMSFHDAAYFGILNPLSKTLDGMFGDKIAESTGSALLSQLSSITPLLLALSLATYYFFYRKLSELLVIFTSMFRMASPMLLSQNLWFSQFLNKFYKTHL